MSLNSPSRHSDQIFLPTAQEMREFLSSRKGFVWYDVLNVPEDASKEEIAAAGDIIYGVYSPAKFKDVFGKIFDQEAYVVAQDIAKVIEYAKRAGIESRRKNGTPNLDDVVETVLGEDYSVLEIEEKLSFFQKARRKLGRVFGNKVLSPEELDEMKEKDEKVRLEQIKNARRKELQGILAELASEDLSYYRFFDIARSATQAQIDVAYKGLTEEFGPEHNYDFPESHQIMKSIDHIYDVLSDSDKRLEHDCKLDIRDIHQRVDSLNKQYGVSIPYPDVSTVENIKNALSKLRANEVEGIVKDTVKVSQHIKNKYGVTLEIPSDIYFGGSLDVLAKLRSNEVEAIIKEYLEKFELRNPTMNREIQSAEVSRHAVDYLKNHWPHNLAFDWAGISNLHKGWKNNKANAEKYHKTIFSDLRTKNKLTDLQSPFNLTQDTFQSLLDFTSKEMRRVSTLAPEYDLFLACEAVNFVFHNFEMVEGEFHTTPNQDKFKMRELQDVFGGNVVAMYKFYIHTFINNRMGDTKNIEDILKKYAAPVTKKDQKQIFHLSSVDVTDLRPNTIHINLSRDTQKETDTLLAREGMATPKNAMVTFCSQKIDDELKQELISIVFQSEENFAKFHERLMKQKCRTIVEAEIIFNKMIEKFKWDQLKWSKNQGHNVIQAQSCTNAQELSALVDEFSKEKGRLGYKSCKINSQDTVHIAADLEVNWKKWGGLVAGMSNAIDKKEMNDAVVNHIVELKKELLKSKGDIRIVDQNILLEVFGTSEKVQGFKDSFGYQVFTDFSYNTLQTFNDKINSLLKASLGKNLPMKAAQVPILDSKMGKFGEKVNSKLVGVVKSTLDTISSKTAFFEGLKHDLIRLEEIMNSVPKEIRRYISLNISPDLKEKHSFNVKTGEIYVNLQNLNGFKDELFKSFLPQLNQALIGACKDHYFKELRNDLEAQVAGLTVMTFEQRESFKKEHILLPQHERRKKMLEESRAIEALSDEKEYRTNFDSLFGGQHHKAEEFLNSEHAPALRLSTNQALIDEICNTFYSLSADPQVSHSVQSIFFKDRQAVSQFLALYEDTFLASNADIHAFVKDKLVEFWLNMQPRGDKIMAFKQQIYMTGDIRNVDAQVMLSIFGTEEKVKAFISKNFQKIYYYKNTRKKETFVQILNGMFKDAGVVLSSTQEDFPLTDIDYYKKDLDEPVFNAYLEKLQGELSVGGIAQSDIERCIVEPVGSRSFIDQRDNFFSHPSISSHFFASLEGKKFLIVSDLHNYINDFYNKNDPGFLLQNSKKNILFRALEKLFIDPETKGFTDSLQYSLEPLAREVHALFTAGTQSMKNFMSVMQSEQKSVPEVLKNCEKIVSGETLKSLGIDQYDVGDTMIRRYTLGIVNWGIDSGKLKNVDDLYSCVVKYAEVMKARLFVNSYQEFAGKNSREPAWMYFLEARGYPILPYVLEENAYERILIGKVYDQQERLLQAQFKEILSFLTPHMDDTQAIELADILHRHVAQRRHMQKFVDKQKQLLEDEEKRLEDEMKKIEEEVKVRKEKYQDWTGLGAQLEKLRVQLEKLKSGFLNLFKNKKVQAHNDHGHEVEAHGGGHAQPAQAPVNTNPASAAHHAPVAGHHP